VQPQGLPVASRALLAIAVITLGAAILLTVGGILPKAVGALGSMFAGFLDSSPTPSLVPSSAPVTEAPSLEAPDEPYTSQAAVDIAGTVPVSIVGLKGYTVRLYQAMGQQAPIQVAEQEVGLTSEVTFLSVKLVQGANDLTATIVGPSGESEPSGVVTYVLDTAAPAIKITSPKKDAKVNGTIVKINGTTQGRSTLLARNAANGNSATGQAKADGTFTISVPIALGSNAISLTSTDPAGNARTAVINVRRGAGKLSARLTANTYRISAAKLPRQLVLKVVVTNPDGRPVDNAAVTFTVTVPGLPAITGDKTTDATGTATFKTTIPKGATVGSGPATALVTSDSFGTATGKIVVTITK
jgi:hypothetical protein